MRCEGTGVSSNSLFLAKGNDLTYLPPPPQMVWPCKSLKTTTYVITTDSFFQMLWQLSLFLHNTTKISSKLKNSPCGCVTSQNVLEVLLWKAKRRIQRVVLTACFVLEMSSIWTCRSSISTSMDLRALTAAAQVNSDSSSWNRHNNLGRCISSVIPNVLQAI